MVHNCNVDGHRNSSQLAPQCPSASAANRSLSCAANRTALPLGNKRRNSGLSACSSVINEPCNANANGCVSNAQEFASASAADAHIKAENQAASCSSTQLIFPWMMEGRSRTRKSCKRSATASASAVCKGDTDDRSDKFAAAARCNDDKPSDSGKSSPNLT